MNTNKIKFQDLQNEIKNKEKVEAIATSHHIINKLNQILKGEIDDYKVDSKGNILWGPYTIYFGQMGECADLYIGFNSGQGIMFGSKEQLLNAIKNLDYKKNQLKPRPTPFAPPHPWNGSGQPIEKKVEPFDWDNEKNGPKFSYGLYTDLTPNTP